VYTLSTISKYASLQRGKKISDNSLQSMFQRFFKTILPENKPGTSATNPWLPKQLVNELKKQWQQQKLGTLFSSKFE